jgi:hypothetical protein
MISLKEISLDGLMNIVQKVAYGMHMGSRWQVHVPKKYVAERIEKLKLSETGVEGILAMFAKDALKATYTTNAGWEALENKTINYYILENRHSPDWVRSNLGWLYNGLCQYSPGVMLRTQRDDLWNRIEKAYELYKKHNLIRNHNYDKPSF